MHPVTRQAIPVLLCVLALGLPLRAQDPPVNQYGAAVKAFRDRLDEYLALQRKAAGTVPALKQTDDSAKLTAREQAIGEAVRQARPQAKAGDIFGDDLTARIRDVIRKDWARRSAADRAGLAEDMPPSAVADVNATYPPSLPLALPQPSRTCGYASSDDRRRSPRSRSPSAPCPRRTARRSGGPRTSPRAR